MTRPKLYTRSATTAATAAMLGTVVIGAKTLTIVRGGPAGTAEAPWEKGRARCGVRPDCGRSSQLFRAFVWGAAGATTARMRRCLDNAVSKICYRPEKDTRRSKACSCERAI